MPSTHTIFIASQNTVSNALKWISLFKNPILFCSWFTCTPEGFIVLYSSFVRIFSYSLEATLKKVSWGHYSKLIKSDKKINIVWSHLYGGNFKTKQSNNKASYLLLNRNSIYSAFIGMLNSSLRFSLCSSLSNLS